MTARGALRALRKEPSEQLVIFNESIKISSGRNVYRRLLHNAAQIFLHKATARIDDRQRVSRECTIQQIAIVWGGANGWAAEGPYGMTADNCGFSFVREGLLEVLGSPRMKKNGIGTRGGWKLTKN